MPPKPKPIEDRFWPKVDKRGPGECWPWLAATNQHGYGVIGKPRKQRGCGSNFMAHRLSYEIHKGPIPDGMFIDHMCHNRACVNPAHLQTVTNKQNQENRSGPQRNSKTGIRGVSWDSREKRWLAAIGHNGRHVYVGHFCDIEDAEKAVITKRNELFQNNLTDRVVNHA